MTEQKSIYEYIEDQRGTATPLRIASHIDMGVNAVIAHLLHLESIGCIKRDGIKTDRARWTAIREPNAPIRIVGQDVFGVRV